MVYNDTISIFDSFELDGNTKIIQYILSRCYLEMSIGSSINMNGEIKNYNATLYIPKNYVSDVSYVKPKVWGSLSLEDKLKYFTLRDNQIICMLSDYKNYNSLNDILNNEDDCFRVIGVDCFDKVLSHFEVICK